VNNLTTGNNGWHGVDVDKAGAILTVNGTSDHTETVPDIYVDDTTVGQVVDTNNQYASKDNMLVAGDRVYDLKLAAPSLAFPANNGYTTSNDFYFDWDDITGASGYEFQNSLTGGTNPDGSLSSVHYSTSASESRLHSTGAPDGTARYWQVRAVDSLGVPGPWSAPWKMTIDMALPTVHLVSPSNGNVTKGASVTQSWASSSSDVDHYQYESYNDAGLTSLRFSTTYTSTSKTATDVTDSSYWWRIRAVDFAGNMSAWTPAWKLTVDNTPPTITPVNYVGDVTTKVFSKVSFSFYDAHSIVGFDLNGHYGALSPSNWSNYDFPNLLAYFGMHEGSNTITAYDAAGNKFPYTFTYDGEPPTVPQIAQPIAGQYFNGNSTTNSWTVSTDDSGVVNYKVKYVLGATTVYRTTTSTSRSQTFTGNYQGAITISVQAQDAAGNWSEFGTPVTYGYDSVDPQLSIDSYNATDNVVTPSVTASDVSPGSGIFTTVWTADDAASTAGVTISNTNALEPTFTANADGTYSFTLTVTDNAGNSNTASFSFTYATPVTPPASGGSGPSSESGSGSGVSNVTATNPATGNTPQVLGASTGTPNAPSDTSTTDGNVKGDSTTKDLNTTDSNASKDAANNNFLGLGWWWLLVLLALGFPLWILGKRRAAKDA
jgi:hypothetical protein